jgi:hypothetical protein
MAYVALIQTSHGCGTGAVQAVDGGIKADKVEVRDGSGFVVGTTVLPYVATIKVTIKHDSYGDLMPGDTITVASCPLGALNGTYTLEGIDYSESNNDYPGTTYNAYMHEPAT